ncbi:MAG: GspH/FimT family pseudopilin [Zoogloeaceae bacterium]|jgi:prepilin-type N-terminal cleavage/methylation domain-containing protein|nr:GspH/FimT family pseudopilin [Zoogloeaceae bacterium]
MRNFDRTRGFTLIELMIVVLLIAIFAAFAAPSFKHRMARTKVESYANELLTALRYARSEAIARGEEVSLEAKPGSILLEEGWIVKTKRFGDPDDTDPSLVLRTHAPLNGVKICMKAGGTGEGDCGKEMTFVFSPRGSMKATVDDAPLSRLTILLRPEDYNPVAGDSSEGTGLLLEIGSLGHARVSEV